MKYSQRLRMAYIDWRLYTYGVLCCEDIMRNFEISSSQASDDIKAFKSKSMYPKAMIYDSSARRYVPRVFPYRFVTVFAPKLGAAGNPLCWD